MANKVKYNLGCNSPLNTAMKKLLTKIATPIIVKKEIFDSLNC